MNSKDMDGKKLSGIVRLDLEKQVSDFRERYCCSPQLAIVTVGDDPSISTYIRSKQKAARKVGIESVLRQIPESSSLSLVQETIMELNRDPDVHGIIVELPLPHHIPYAEVVMTLDPRKDIDGLHPLNLGLLYGGNPIFVPNTPKAVVKILEHYEVDLEGREVTIVGRSISVGKPLAALLMGKNATVTICHSRTKDLKKHCLTGDVLVASVGKARLITGDMVKEGAVVIDVGINVVEGSITGDVDYETVYPKASMITPVPGGVGPLTVSMILENTLLAARRQLEARTRCSEAVSAAAGEVRGK